MTKIKIDYFFVLIYALCSIVLTSLIIGLSTMMISRDSNLEKLSPYECGFDPFEDARNEVDVRFYLLAILFIIFDIEAAFLFPWMLSLANVESNLLALAFFIDFMFELVVALIYAWFIGAFEWE